MVDVNLEQNNITITITPTSTTSEVTISSGGTSASAGVSYGAEIYAERAKSYATQAGTSATLAGNYATSAQVSATTASASATSASASMTNSSIWAEGTDAEVQSLGGTHSSKVWSLIASDKNYIYEQGTVSAEWTVTHNLNKYPSVSVVDSSGDEIICDINYIDQNNCKLVFTSAFKGTAYFN